MVSYQITALALHSIQKEDELEGLKTIRSVAELPAPAETSISIVTPPKVSCSVFIPDNVLED